nr:glycosyltransferase family 4 protein [Caulobacter sp. 17J65-9]
MDGGGAERVITHMSRHWAMKGDAVCLVTITGPDRKVYDVDPRVRLIHLDLDQPSKSGLGKLQQILFRIWSVRREIRRFKPDAALGFMPSSAVLLALAALGIRCRTIGCERNYPPKLPLSRAWELARRHLYRLLDCVSVQTEAAEVWIRTNTTARRTVVIPNALPWPLVDSLPTLEPDAAIPPDRLVALAAGRLNPAKGFDNLVRAFGVLARRWPEWDLVILGEGDERERLKELIDELGLSGRVFMPGRAGNLSEWFSRAELFVLSSRTEGFPNILLEAMGAGVPAVATDCQTGPRELIDDGVNGLLAPEGDPLALANVLERLVSDPNLRLKFAEAGKVVRDRFAEPAIMLAWEEELRVANSPAQVSDGDALELVSTSATGPN